MSRSLDLSEASSAGRPRRATQIAGLVLAALSTFIAPPAGGGEADARGPTRAELVRADRLHRDGITGRGITIAVVGATPPAAPELLEAAGGHRRLLAVFDATGKEPAPADALSPLAGSPGRGERTLAAMLSRRRDGQGRFAGIAPGADLAWVRAFADDGGGRVADVVRGIGWIVDQRERYGIRVLVLPLVAEPQPAGQEDSLGRAVVAAWRAGIVVVAAAGDGGPGRATVSAPGDVAWVVTVGAAGLATGEPLVAASSGAGPTAAGFVKPDLVAPGLTVADGAGELGTPADGTATAAAVVGGIAALLLEGEPWLTPDQVKHRLRAGARPAVGPAGEPAYPVLRQGAGLVDAFAAARSGSFGAANRGLELAFDLAAETVIDGEPWPGWPGDAYLWADGYDDGTTADGYTWSDLPDAFTGGADRREEESGSEPGEVPDGEPDWSYTWSDRPAAPFGYTWSDTE